LPQSSCCAHAASGHATAAPPSSVMNSRRFTTLYLPCFRTKGIAHRGLLRCGISTPAMTAQGRSRPRGRFRTIQVCPKDAWRDQAHDPFT
jgi:hypothetical protein